MRAKSGRFRKNDILRQSKCSTERGGFSGRIADAFATPGRKAKREQDVVHHRSKWQQIKLLKDHPDLLSAELIPRSAG